MSGTMLMYKTGNDGAVQERNEGAVHLPHVQLQYNSRTTKEGKRELYKRGCEGAGQERVRLSCTREGTK